VADGVPAARRAGLALATVLAAAAVWRGLLAARYWGWEESDYGNLAMARGVLASGFTRFDMNHLPGYYAVSAAVLALTGDAVAATRIVSGLGGLTALAGAVWLAIRVGGARAGWVAGLLLAFQPEFALYSSTSLREPLYGGLLVVAVLLAARERPLAAGLAAAAAFLVRMDALVVAGPVLALQAIGHPPRGRRLAAALLPLAVAAVAWSVYCRVAYGTYAFWGHSVEVNLETGLGAEASTRLAWAGNGLRVAAVLLAGVLPDHLGWLPWAGALLALGPLLAAGHGERRALGAALLATTAFWLGTAFLAQHEPGHNLYWKWMFPLVPFWTVAGVLGLLALLDRAVRAVGRALPWTVTALLLGATLARHLGETGRQMDQSEALYRPQVELARRIEAEIPESVPMVLDNIPERFLSRRPHERDLRTWLDLEPGSPEAFGAYLARDRVGWVLWFREAWTRAPVVAPFLAGGGAVRCGPVDLVERDREEGYGWIWYEVVPVDAPGGAGYRGAASGQ